MPYSTTLGNGIDAAYELKSIKLGENDVVLVYLKQGGEYRYSLLPQNMVARPTDSKDITKAADPNKVATGLYPINVTYNYTEQYINITNNAVTASPNAYKPNSVYFGFRVVVLRGIAGGRLSNEVNFNDYKSVKRQFSLPD